MHYGGKTKKNLSYCS